MRKLVYASLAVILALKINAEPRPVLRSFPAGTQFALITKINYPQVTLQEIPSNWGTNLLGLMWLSSKKVEMSPASVIRDQENNTHVQAYLDTLKNEPVAVQFDFQGRIWVVWQLTKPEIQRTIKNKQNIW